MPVFRQSLTSNWIIKVICGRSNNSDIMNIFMKAIILIVVFACMFSSSAYIPKTYERCNPMEFFQNVQDLFLECSQSATYSTAFCQASCKRGDESLSTQSRYTCKVVKGKIDGAIWVPEVPPRCVKDKEMEKCDINYFTKDISNISFTCTKHNNSEVYCRAHCSAIAGYASPEIYHCKVTPGIRGGNWTPANPPTCVNVSERCNPRMFAEGRTNINWICMQNSVQSNVKCTASCPYKDEHLAHGQTEYKCKADPEVEGGKWEPNVPPICVKSSEKCNPDVFAKDKNIEWGCIHYYFVNRITCKPSCKFEDEHFIEEDGIFITPREYKCEVAEGIIGGQWEPNVPPKCVRYDANKTINTHHGFNEK